ncbi:FAD-binding oxidoreductase [Bdellovibrionales bacterium]|nr:FAD-binding oxidoreductase [Bdellovibrionales bacterium]
MSFSYWQDGSSKINHPSFDLVVIGGGISGLSAAYWLQKEDPSLKIALLEKNQIASGASGRNAGFITSGSVEHYNRLVERWGEKLAREIWSFSERNLELLKEEFLENLDFKKRQQLGFEERGSFSLASTESELEELKKTSRLMKKHQIEVELLEEADVEKRLGVTGFRGGVKYLHDASINPVELCRWIAGQFRGDLFEGTEVSRVTQDGEERVVHTNRGEFHTSAVVYAGNGYLPSLDPFFDEMVFPTRGQILVTEPVPRFMEGPCYANFVLDYFRQLESGEVIIGGFRQLEKVTEVGYSDHITETIQSALYDFLQKHIPHLSGKLVTHRWAGVMGFSADGQPFVGAKPDDSQIFYLGGFTAHGLGLAFHSGRCLADLVFGRKIPDFLSGRRF